MTKTVLILGPSGKIGSHAARAFAARGWQIRNFNRATDDMTAAAMGCAVIVNGLNPPNYHNWAGLIPAITAQVIAAARASGAMVIVPGNVYHFGATPGEWSEKTQPAPCSRKGRIRLDMERTYRQSGVQTLILRAGNFVDPGHNNDVMSLVIMSRMKRGTLTSPGDPDAMQAYAYLPDWGRAAADLAEKRADLAMFEDVPFPGHAFTLNELRAALEREMHRPVRIAGFPWWLMRLASPVWELARELVEMRYLWNTSHSLSSRRFNQLLPDFTPTGMRTVMLAGLPDQIHPDKPVPAGRHGDVMA